MAAPYEKPKNEDKSKNDELAEIAAESRGRAVGRINPYTAPWWLVIMVVLWVYVIFQMAAQPDYSEAFAQLKQGITLTLWLSFASYILALAIGLLSGIVRAYPPQQPNTKLNPRRFLGRVVYTAVYNFISVYIEFMRGIPPIVFLLIAGFIIVPAIREPVQGTINATIVPLVNHVVQPVIETILRNDLEPMEEILWRGRDPGTAIAGLALIYGAFLSEVFRAGIQAVPKGQVEAARSLGMNYFQTMRLIVIPQAVRNVLPPLGNNFISMIKDTSLVTVLGTSEITQIARKWTGSQFTYLETYMVLSMIYLTLTVTGSILVQLMERRLRKFAKG